MQRDRPNAGDVFTVVYPFVRAPFEWFDDEGPVTLKSWKPGINIEADGDCYGPDIFADSEGEMVLTVVDVFKPGRFPTRVFYTRQFVDPDGKRFGKAKLQIATLEKFRRISTRYQVAYDVEETHGQAAERRAQAIEARSVETTKIGSIEDESASRQGAPKGSHDEKDIRNVA